MPFPPALLLVPAHLDIMPKYNARKARSEVPYLSSKGVQFLSRKTNSFRQMRAAEELEKAANCEPTRLKENPDIEVRGIAGAGRGLFFAGKDGQRIIPGECGQVSLPKVTALKLPSLLA